jgi:hypothetical protein
MKPTKIKSVFENEAALCAAFIAALPEGWTAYAETAGFDILLVRSIDGAQIGVEAKMTLNAKVLLQSVEGIYSGHGSEHSGPDFRAALVPYGAAGAEMKTIARFLGVTIIEARAADEGDKEIERQVAAHGEFYRKYASRDYKAFKPELPSVGNWYDDRGWVDFCPVKKCVVPEYVPDVVAGASGPSQLSEWKIKAIKIAIILERRGYVTGADFAHIKIDRKRWHDMGWLSSAVQDGKYIRGQYVSGPTPLDLRSAHPVNFGQIESDFDKWKPPETAAAFQGALL